MTGKGDGRRPATVSRETYYERYAQTFRPIVDGMEQPQRPICTGWDGKEPCNNPVPCPDHPDAELLEELCAPNADDWP